MAARVETVKNLKALYSKLSLALVGLMVILYVITFSVLSIRRHEAFQTNGYDLGNVDQTVWNTLHGRLFYFTNMDGVEMKGLESRLALHFEPILLPISLTYLIYSSPVTLLVLQTVVLALGAWPAFRLAREKLGSDFAGLTFAAVYLLFPALEAANMFDFHAVTLAAPFLLFALYYLQRQEQARFALFAALAMSCKEDVCLLVALIGLYMAIVQREWKAGALTAAGGALWFYLAVFVITPPFSPVGANIHWGRYSYLGDIPGELGILSWPGVVIGQLAEARALNYLWGLLAPLAFLPLLSPLTLALALPSLAINLLSQDAFMHRLEEFHYAAPIVPFVLVSGVYGVGALSRWLGRRWGVSPHRSVSLLSAAVLLVSLGYHCCRGFSPLAAPFRWPPLTPHHRLAQEFIDMIPPEAMLTAQTSLNPHVSQRERIYLWPFVQDAEYILLDVASLANKDGIHGELKDWMAEGKDYGVMASKDGYILLRRGAPRASLSEDFYTFVRAENPAIQYPMMVDFGELRFLGFDALYNREEEVNFNLYWQALREIDRDYFIALYLLDERGAVVGSTVEAQPVTVWYPTSRWRPGEVVRVVANTLSWWTRDRARYGVALGVVDGADPWDIERRLGPQVREMGLAPRLPADGTLLRLMEFNKVCGMPRGIEERRVFTPPRAQHQWVANLRGQVQLMGYDLNAGFWQRISGIPTLRPGDVLHLTLYWQALTEMERSYTVFTHLLDGEGRVWGGKDNPPVGGTAPTTLWVEGEFIRDEYEIPLDPGAPSGEYRLEVGMYDSLSGERLLLLDQAGRIQDSRVLLDKTVVKIR